MKTSAKSPELFASTLVKIHGVATWHDRLAVNNDMSEFRLSGAKLAHKVVT